MIEKRKLGGATEIIQVNEEFFGNAVVYFLFGNAVHAGKLMVIGY